MNWSAAVVVRGVQWLCRAVLFVLGVRRQTIGAPMSGGGLVLANHLSWLDIVVVLAEYRVAFVAKSEVRDWPIVGDLAAVIGVVFIDRTRRRDLLRSVPRLEQRLRDGHLVVLFPEGTTTDGRTLRPFKSALVEAAVRAGAAVQPLVLRGYAAGDPHALCWIEDESLLANLPRVRRTRNAMFVMEWITPHIAGIDRKQITREVESTIRGQLDGGALQRRVQRPRDSSGFMVTLRRMIISVARGAAAFFVALLVVTGLLYMQAPRYDFGPAQPFHGRQWYNPYATAETGSLWWRANLHSHARAWGGLTAGRQHADEVVRQYRVLGTQVIGISDYHANPDTRPHGTVAVYEHGWNLAKAHRLAIGASSVLWFDFPLWGSVHEEQFAIDRLHAHADLVAVVHPGLRHGHTPASLAQLGNFELLEVLNHFLPPADAAWDAALSAGRPVWILASDDSHDVTGTGETGTNFTRILARDTSAAAIVHALRDGRAYGVRTRDHRGTLHLRDLHMRGDTLVVRVQGVLRRLTVIGQGGQVRNRWITSARRDTSVVLRTVANGDDGYLRVIAEGENEWLYTNPVVRWNGTALPMGLATVNEKRTVLRQTAWRLGYSWLALWWLARLPLGRLWRRARRTGAYTA